jgi:very-short-patch-repair endonuclease
MDGRGLLSPLKRGTAAKRQGVALASIVQCAFPMKDEKWGIRNIRSKETFRKKLRKSATAAEAVLWKHLQRRQILGKKFRRQHSIGRYIVDFYCPESRLIIELDGAAHYSITIDEYEAKRTKYLEGLGLKIIRFENRELQENMEGVLETIRQNLEQPEK